MSDPLVVVGDYYDITEAVLARARLEAEGIRAMVQTDHAGGIEPQLAWALGVRVLVREPDAERARLVLAIDLAAGGGSLADDA